MPANDPADRPIVHFLYEPGAGGLDRVAILLANAMAARGLASELWLTRKDGPLAGLISDQVRVRLVPAPKLGNRGMRLFLQIPSLARMIRKFQPRVMYSAGNQSNLNIALARNLAGAADTRIVQKITNPVVRPEMGAVTGWLRSRRFGLTASLGDLCLTLTAADARTNARLMPGAADRFQAVRNAYIDDAMLARGAVPRTRSAGAPAKLLSVGRLAYQKDQATMLRALGRIADLPWTLRLLGDGPLRSELEALAGALGIADRVRFEGFVQDPGEAYAASDIMLLSSRWEGFPAAPLEAMAAGCDVVVTDCSEGLSDIFTGLGRVPVPIGDDAGLALAIRQAIARAQPPPAMRDLAGQYAVEASVTDHLRLAGLG